MIRTPKALLLAAALLLAIGACTRTDGVTAPERARLDVQALPDTMATTQQDSTPGDMDADTTGRYGGSLGSGT